MSPATAALIAGFEVTARRHSKTRTLCVRGWWRGRPPRAPARLRIPQAQSGAYSADRHSFGRSEKTAVAQGLAVVRAELCWESDSDTRIETWSHFRPVVGATFAALAPTAAGGVGQWRPLCRHPAETIVSLRLPSLDLRS
jgi:hypothetical protein